MITYSVTHANFERVKQLFVSDWRNYVTVNDNCTKSTFTFNVIMTDNWLDVIAKDMILNFLCDIYNQKYMIHSCGLKVLTLHWSKSKVLWW